EQQVRLTEHQRRPSRAAARTQPVDAAALLRPRRRDVAGAGRLELLRQARVGNLRARIRKRTLLESAGSLLVPDGLLGAWRSGSGLRVQPRRLFRPRPRGNAARSRTPAPRESQ